VPPSSKDNAPFIEFSVVSKRGLWFADERPAF